MDPTWTDGNDIAGTLSEVFAVDVTVARGTCASCSTTGPLAETHAFTRAPGIVVRCPRCDEVVLRMVRTSERAWLDMRGLSVLELPL